MSEPCTVIRQVKIITLRNVRNSIKSAFLTVGLLMSLFATAKLENGNGFNNLDSDLDGYPDIVEITSTADRKAFLDWFAAIAEAQYTKISLDWDPKYQDCSGLLRYAFIESLKPKTASWYTKFDYLPVTLPPVQSLNYPLPKLSRSTFRISAGSYQVDDIRNGYLVGLASSAELMHHATVPLGRTLAQVERGDLLFFAHPLAEGSGYHSMVYLGNNMIVYHTGLTPSEGGEVRLLSLDTLSRHPDKHWHPKLENPHFLGFFRWKIVD